jgi:undecaprenyl pyrophosphate synthase
LLERLPVKTSDLLKPADSQEAELLEKLDLKRLPQHVAIIMDGNGRWAERRHLPRAAGHRSGVKAARVIIETCSRFARKLAPPAGRGGVSDAPLAGILETRAPDDAEEQYPPAVHRPH